jgi:predicted ribosomally synthesized peptide with nif11-like leader
MSVDNAKRLIEKMQTDANLRQTFQQAGEKAFAATAKAAGHDVTAADMQAALHQVNISQLSNLRPQLPGGSASIVAIASVAVI